MIETVIYDCDNMMGLPREEIDDGLTLLYLLGRSDIELLGVTTTFGNGPIDRVHRATDQLLRQVGREDLPLVKGAGRRGQPPTAAARFLAQTVAARPGKVTLLATGPLGNLAAAAELDPDFFRNLKAIACMGGYLYPLRIGWRSIDELNLSADPEATLRVLHAACPVTLMNAHVCLQAPFRWRDLQRLDFWPTEIRRMVRNWLLAFGLYCGVREFYLWDLLPAVYLSYPELFDENPVRVDSDVADMEDGMVVLAEEGCAPIDMPTRIRDPQRFREVLFRAWSRVRISV